MLNPVLLERLRAWWRLGHAQGKIGGDGWLFPGLDPVDPVTARLHGHEQERVITSAGQTATVRRFKQRVDLFAHEKADLCPAAALAGHGQDPLNLGRAVRHLEGRIAEERANGGQPQIAAAGADASTLLQVLQERTSRLERANGASLRARVLGSL